MPAAGMERNKDESPEEISGLSLVLRLWELSDDVPVSVYLTVSRFVRGLEHVLRVLNHGRVAAIKRCLPQGDHLRRRIDRRIWIDVRVRRVQ